MAVVFPSNSSSFWKEISLHENSGVIQVHRKLHLSFPPYYLADLKKSVKSVIDSRLTCYEPDLGGILATYGRIAILKSEGATLFNLSEIHVDVEGDFYVFCPKIDQQLVGVVNSKSDGHVGCLVHGVFNVSLYPFHNRKNAAADKLPLKLLEVGDNVRFAVTKLDLESQVPYIEGRYITKITDPTKMEDIMLIQPNQNNSSVGLVDIATPKPTPSIEKKRSKLSLSQRKNEAALQLQPSSDNLPPSDERKRKLTADSPIPETPKNKKIKISTDSSKKLSDSSNLNADEEDAVNSLVTNLFSVVSRKQAAGSIAQKKNSTMNSSAVGSDLNLSPRVSESIQKVSIPEELSVKVIKELESSIYSATKKSKKKTVDKEKTLDVEKDVVNPADTDGSRLELRNESEKEIDSNLENENQVSILKSPKKSKSIKRQRDKDESTTRKQTKDPVHPSDEELNHNVTLTEALMESSAIETPKKIKKKKKVKQADDEDNESIIKELLESSLGGFTSKSTPKSKGSAVKSSKASSMKAPEQKTKVPLSEKLIDTPSSVKAKKISSPIKKPNTDSVVKSSHFVTEKFVLPESPLPTSPVKQILEDSKAEKVKTNKKKKKNSEVVKKEDGSDEEFDPEEAIRNIMKLVQPKDKSSGKSTGPKKKRQRN